MSESSAAVGPSWGVEFVQIVLRNVSQVVLQNNALSGAVILFGIFYHSIDFGFAALIGSIVSTITAQYFKVDKGAIAAGLYGFNGVLTGIAIVFYCETTFDVVDIPIWAMGVCVAFGAAFSSVFTAAIGAVTSQWDVPPLTAPFVLASWVFVAGTHFTPALLPGHNLPHDPAAAVSADAAVSNDAVVSTDAPVGGDDATSANIATGNHYTLGTWWRGIGKGMGEVFFQDDAVSGYIIFAGIMINSRISVVMALIGSLISIAIAELLHVHESDINMGMYSYSAILTAIALGGMFFALNVRGFVFTILAVVLTTWLYPAMAAICQTVHLSAYTTPFIVATWLMMFSKGSFEGLIPIPLAEATKPEDHLRFLKRESA